jgi:hypothetical protein
VGTFPFAIPSPRLLRLVQRGLFYNASPSATSNMSMQQKSRKAATTCSYIQKRTRRSRPLITSEIAQGDHRMKSQQKSLRGSPPSESTVIIVELQRRPFQAPPRRVLHRDLHDQSALTLSSLRVTETDLSNRDIFSISRDI